MGFKKYTPTQDRFIFKHAGVLTAQQIADELGVKKGGVHSAFKRLGVNGIRKGENHHGCKLSSLQVAMVTTLYDAGFTVNEIYNALFEKHSVSLNGICDVCAARTRKDG